MAETDLYRRVPDNRTQILSRRSNIIININALLLKKVHNYETLCSEIEELPQIISWLCHNGVITREEFREVNSVERRRQGVAKLLEILFTKTTEQWVAKFQEVLEVTGQSHVIARLTRRTPPNSPSAIRPLRKKDYKLRVMLLEEDPEDAVRRQYSVERVRDTRAILDSDVVSIYEGSIVFILEPSSENAIKELWERNVGSYKIRKFLGMILRDYEFKEKFTRKRIIRVELTEEPNEFHCRVHNSSCEYMAYTLDISPQNCSECFRRTVIECYENILDEIETKMIQETLQRKDSIVPDFIKIACIDEKYKRTRKERAEIFLKFVLTHEGLLMDFKHIFHETSKFRMPRVPCDTHGGDTMEKLHFREKIVLHFEIYFDRSDNTMVVNSVSSRVNKIMKLTTEKDLSRQKVQEDMLKLVNEDNSYILENGYFACDLYETDRMEATFHGLIDVLLSKVNTDRTNLDIQRLKAIREVRNKLVYSPLSVSAEDLSVYQENYRLALVDIDAENVRKWIVNDVTDVCFINTDWTNHLMELTFECNVQPNTDNIRSSLQNTKHRTHLEDLNEDLQETRIVLIGDQFGKAANQLLNNCMLGGNKSEMEPKRETYKDLHFKKKIVVTRAPELRFDEMQHMDVRKQIGKALIMTAPGPHLFMLVVQQEELRQLNDMIQSLVHIFGESTLQYTMISIIGEVQSVKNQLKKIKNSTNIKDIAKKDRIFFMKDGKLNFSYRNIFVENVLQIIEQIARTMGQEHFTNTTYEKAEELVMRKTRDLCTTNQEEYRRHELATASLKARMTPHQILKKRITDSNPREEIIQNVDKVIDLEFLRCLNMTLV